LLRRGGAPDAARPRGQVAPVATAHLARDGVLEIPGRFELHHGGVLEAVRVAYRLTGATGTPVVAALGGISAGRFVAATAGGERGWWPGLVGPGRALDSERFRVLGLDFLGGSGDTTGPVGGEEFPSVSSYDQARILVAVLNHLGLAALHAIVGASYGGMVGLAFAERYPERVARLLVMSAADATHPMATAWRSVQRSIVRLAERQGAGREGLKIARALAMATYRSPEEFSARFRAPQRATDGGFRFPVEDYLFARGEDYAARYVPQAFLCLSESIDLHAVDAARVTTPTTLVAVREDQLVPLADMRALNARLAGPHQLVELSSIYGHDAFLKEAERLKPIFRATLEGDSP
jgi:homoserine O-acetyltransferase